MADGAARLAAHELERIGILLLRHHAAAGRRRIGQLEEAEFLARHQDEVLGDAREVHHRQRHRVQEARREVAIGRGVHAVGHDAAEAQPVGEELRVDRRSRCRRSRRSRAAARSPPRAPLRGARDRGAAPPRGSTESATPARASRAAGACTTASAHRRPSPPDRRTRRWWRAASACSSGMRRRRYSRRSTETCSLRERPVCRRRPASPMRDTSWRSTNECTSSSSPFDPRRILAALLENRGESVGDRLGCPRHRARRRAPAPRPTPGCRSRRLRTGADRTGTTRRNQTRPDPAPSQIVPTTTA